jgi:hypothetical protein
MALGADARRVVSSCSARRFARSWRGLVIGVAGAITLVRFIETFLI